MILVVVLLVVTILGAGCFACGQRLREDESRRDEVDPSMAFLLEEISARVLPRQQSPVG